MPTAYVEVPLSKGYVALVDVEDYPRVAGYTWTAQEAEHTVYGYTRAFKPNGRRTTLKLHRLIMNAPSGLQVDHVNGNGLDNRRDNLRLATRRQNGTNRGPQTNNTSGFKGVSWHKASQRWHARIVVNGRCISLGYHRTAQGAGAAYDEAAKQHHGEFARLNLRCPDPLTTKERT